MDIAAALISNAQASETMPPTEALVRFNAALGNPHSDAALAQPDAMAPVVIAFVAVQFCRTLARSTCEAGNRWQRGDPRLQHTRIMNVRPRNLRHQWHAPLVDDDVMLAAELTAIGRVWSSLATPRGGWHPGRVDAGALPLEDSLR